MPTIDNVTALEVRLTAKPTERKLIKVHYVKSILILYNITAPALCSTSNVDLKAAEKLCKIFSLVCYM